jgi:Cd2+/Zn2+-exporting ATPase
MIGRFSQVGVYRELARSHEFYRITFAGGLVLASYLWDRGNESESTIGVTLVLLSLVLNGLPIVWNAIKGLFQRKVNVDELVSLAIIASVIQGEFLTAAFVSFVMVLGGLIEQVTSDSARQAIKSLVSLAPETATQLVEGATRTIPITDVEVGNRLLMRPGERVPVDGVIKKGTAAVDESSITGEPVPREKTPGDGVYTGTLNQNGVIEVEVTKVGKDTTLGKVIKLVASAEAHKPQAIRLIDRYARWFTPTILLCAGITWGLTGELSKAVTVLIVGCPCALILAAPTAIVATVGRAARVGILVKADFSWKKRVERMWFFSIRPELSRRESPGSTRLFRSRASTRKKCLPEPRPLNSTALIPLPALYSRRLTTRRLLSPALKRWSRR